MAAKTFLTHFKQAMFADDVRAIKSRQRLREFLQLIRPVSLGLQIASVAMFIVTLLLSDPRYVYDVRQYAGVIALTLVSIVLAARYTSLLSLFSIMTVWLMATGFSMMGEQSPNRPFFAATLAITVSLVVAPIFARTREYVVAVVGVYLILGKGEIIRPPGDYDQGWLLMLTVVVFALGNFLNLTAKNCIGKA